MTVKTMTAAIGKTGTFRVAGLEISITVLDARQAYGRIDYRISPVAGSGSVWVAATSVRLAEETVPSE